jgi:hypothetical protein
MDLLESRYLPKRVRVPDPFGIWFIKVCGFRVDFIANFS